MTSTALKSIKIPASDLRVGDVVHYNSHCSWAVDGLVPADKTVQMSGRYVRWDYASPESDESRLGESVLHTFRAATQLHVERKVAGPDMSEKLFITSADELRPGDYVKQNRRWLRYEGHPMKSIFNQVEDPSVHLTRGTNGVLGRDNVKYWMFPAAYAPAEKPPPAWRPAALRRMARRNRAKADYLTGMALNQQKIARQIEATMAKKSE